MNNTLKKYLNEALNTEADKDASAVVIATEGKKEDADKKVVAALSADNLTKWPNKSNMFKKKKKAIKEEDEEDIDADALEEEDDNEDKDPVCEDEDDGAEDGEICEDEDIDEDIDEDDDTDEDDDEDEPKKKTDITESYIVNASRFMYDDNYVVETKVKVDGKAYASKDAAEESLKSKGLTHEQIEDKLKHAVFLSKQAHWAAMDVADKFSKTMKYDDAHMKKYDELKNNTAAAEAEVEKAEKTLKKHQKIKDPNLDRRQSLINKIYELKHKLNKAHDAYWNARGSRNVERTTKIMTRIESMKSKLADYEKQKENLK